MQGIQMAKEVAQKELSDQKALYEDRIHALETELVHKTSFSFFRASESIMTTKCNTVAENLSSNQCTHNTLCCTVGYCSDKTIITSSSFFLNLVYYIVSSQSHQIVLVVYNLMYTITPYALINGKI